MFTSFFRRDTENKVTEVVSDPLARAKQIQFQLKSELEHFEKTKNNCCNSNMYVNLVKLCEINLKSLDQVQLFLLEYRRCMRQVSKPSMFSSAFDKMLYRFQPRIENLFAEIYRSNPKVDAILEAYYHTLAIAEDVKLSTDLSNDFEIFRVEDLPNLKFHTVKLESLERCLPVVDEEVAKATNLISEYKTIDVHISALRNKIHDCQKERIQEDLYSLKKRDINQDVDKVNFNTRLTDDTKTNVEILLKRELLRRFADSLLFLEKKFLCELSIRAKENSKFPIDVSETLRAYYNDEKVKLDDDGALKSDDLFHNVTLKENLDDLLYDLNHKEVGGDITEKNIRNIITNHLQNNIKKLIFLGKNDVYFATLFQFHNWMGREKTEDQDALPSYLLEYAERMIFSPLQKLPALVAAVMENSDYTTTNKDETVLVDLIKYTKEQVHGFEAFLQVGQEARVTPVLRR